MGNVGRNFTERTVLPLGLQEWDFSEQKKWGGVVVNGNIP